MRLHVLCEDSLHQRFVERLAERWGIARHHCDIDAAPKGENGSAYVLANYPDAVRKLRMRSHDANVCLLVVIDGDREGLARRRRELASALEKAGVDPVDPARVAIVVPTRHIETWIAWLCGHRPIEESRRYKANTADDAEAREVGRAIERGEYSPRRAVDAWEPAMAEEGRHVPALTDARGEVGRIGL